MSTKPRIVQCPYSPNTVDFPSAVNFGTTLFRSLQEHSTDVALVDISTGKSITFEALRLQAESAARHLIGRYRCRFGDVIAIFGANSIEWVVFALAAFRVGAVLTAFNSQLKQDELKTHLQLSGARILLTDEQLANIALDASRQCAIDVIFVIGGSVADCVSADSLLVASDDDVIRTPLPTYDELDCCRSDDVTALILFSGGTTGCQKAVMTSHRNLQASLANIANDGRPPIATLLAKTPVLDEYDLSSVNAISSGGATLAGAIEQMLYSRLPNLAVVGQETPLLEYLRVVVGVESWLRNFMQCQNGYGMTEVTGAFCCTDYMANDVILRGSRRKESTVGVPMYNVSMKVIDTESGKMIGPNEDGEICIKSPTVMLGYANNAKATSEAIDRDGWLHTGDIGHYDEDGYFYIIDRLKELIKYNAYQVAPAELESALLSHEDVADAAVVGLADAKSGELPLAWVVRKPTSTVSEAQLQQYVNDKVAVYKQLRGGVRFTTYIPRSPSGKILRRLLKETMLTSNI